MDDPQHRERKVQRELQHGWRRWSRSRCSRGVSADERQRLAEGMRPRRSDGARSSPPGLGGPLAYVLGKGECEVRVRGEGGAEKLVARIGGANVFGEMGVMTRERRTASVIAATEVECYRIDKDVFKSVLRGRPDMAELMSQ